MKTCNSFKPVIDKKSKILILGSMPGKISLEKNQYYANTRNQFWDIINYLFDNQLPDDYNSRINFLCDKKIALWDVIKNCNRNGSLDSDIKNPEINDFQMLFKNYPDINTIFFNGSKAYDLFSKNIISTDNYPDLIKLPSSSPAHAVKIEIKLEKWIMIKNVLIEEVKNRP